MYEMFIKNVIKSTKKHLPRNLEMLQLQPVTQKGYYKGLYRRCFHIIVINLLVQGSLTYPRQKVLINTDSIVTLVRSSHQMCSVKKVFLKIS